MAGIDETGTCRQHAPQALPPGRLIVDKEGPAGELRDRQAADEIADDGLPRLQQDGQRTGGMSGGGDDAAGDAVRVQVQLAGDVPVGLAGSWFSVPTSTTRRSRRKSRPSQLPARYEGVSLFRTSAPSPRPTARVALLMRSRAAALPA
jgi:hypothetical protein